MTLEELEDYKTQSLGGGLRNCSQTTKKASGIRRRISENKELNCSGKEGIGVRPAVPCPWRTWARVVFPVWSLSTALLTKAYVEDSWGPLALLRPEANKDAHQPPPGPAVLTMHQLHARGLTYPSHRISKQRACQPLPRLFLPHDKPWFFLSCKCSYLSTFNEKLFTFQTFLQAHPF